jgi:hypothetical protein
MILHPFLVKAGKTVALGKKEDALKYFTDIKDNYDVSRGCIS